MKITAIRTHWLSVPSRKRNSTPPTSAAPARSTRHWWRWRPTPALPAMARRRRRSAPGTDAGLVTIVEKELGPLLIGQDPRQISRLWDVMYNGSRAHYAIARGHVFPCGQARARGQRDQRHRHGALGSSGQVAGGAGTPADRRQAAREDAGLSSGGWKPTAEVGAELKSYIDRGNFKAVKMRVGSGDGTLAHSIERVHAARDYLGPDIALMCDAHGTFTVSEAKRFCRAVADCNIDWLEEPVTADDKRGQAEVRAATDIPISCGESQSPRFAFRDLAELSAADIFQPDLSIAGGITEAVRIEAIAAAYQIRFCAASFGRGALFCQWAERAGGGDQRLYRRIFARREPDAARTGGRDFHGRGRLPGNPGPSRTRRDHRPGVRRHIPGSAMTLRPPRAGTPPSRSSPFCAAGPIRSCADSRSREWPGGRGSGS